MLSEQTIGGHEASQLIENYEEHWVVGQVEEDRSAKTINNTKAKIC